jgi:23S rRNA C2498 (ribose-2'-O)-methylase RlmM
VCRAEHKLREVAARTSVFADLQSLQCRVALDVGAAPGGWTQCLLDDLGFEKVRRRRMGSLLQELEDLKEFINRRPGRQ